VGTAKDDKDAVARLALIREVYERLLSATDSFEAENVGSETVYLLGAVATDTKGGYEPEPDSALYKLLDQVFAPVHPVFAYVERPPVITPVTVSCQNGAVEFHCQLGPPDADGLRGGTITSNGLRGRRRGCWTEGKSSAMYDVMESVVLGHACAGVDVASPAYVAGLDAALDAIENNC
jgi:hypothetical protein